MDAVAESSKALFWLCVVAAVIVLILILLGPTTTTTTTTTSDTGSSGSQVGSPATVVAVPRVGATVAVAEATPTKEPCKPGQADYEAARAFNYRGVYFAANPKLRGFDKRIVVHHAIPLEVILQQPCLFTTVELNEASNLRGIPDVLNNSLHSSMLAIEWNKFWASHPKGTATRAEVIAEKDTLDAKYHLQTIAYTTFGV